MLFKSTHCGAVQTNDIQKKYRYIVNINIFTGNLWTFFMLVTFLAYHGILWYILERSRLSFFSCNLESRNLFEKCFAILGQSFLILFNSFRVQLHLFSMEGLNFLFHTLNKWKCVTHLQIIFCFIYIKFSFVLISFYCLNREAFTQ